MADSTLKATRRDVLGKKTRFLRRQGVTPVHIFGQGIESLPLECDTRELKLAIMRKGTTRLMDLAVGEEKAPRSVLIREIQRDALSGELLHVDFYQVSKTQRIRLAVPIVLAGEAPASKLKNNIIEQILNELEVEALPADLPPQIEVDLSPLADVNQAIYVRDIVLKKGVTTNISPEQIVVKVSAIAEEKEEVPVAAAEVAAEAAVAGEAPTAEAETAEKPEKGEKKEG